SLRGGLLHANRGRGGSAPVPDQPRGAAGAWGGDPRPGDRLPSPAVQGGPASTDARPASGDGLAQHRLDGRRERSPGPILKEHIMPGAGELLTYVPPSKGTISFR